MPAGVQPPPAVGPWRAATFPERATDRLVLETLDERQIPTVIVTSGGYSRRSHELVAELAVAVVERLGGAH